MKIFIGVTEISGLATGLKKGLLSAGIDAQTVFRMSHSYGYEDDSNGEWILRTWKLLGDFYSKRAKRKPLIYFFKVLHYVWSWLVFIHALFKFDAFIFFYGRTITNSPIELWLLRLAKRKVVFAGVGGDTRPPYIDGGLFPGSEYGTLPDAASLVKVTKRCKERTRLQERYASYWINYPSAAHFHEKRYISWASIGVPRVFIYPDIEIRKKDTTIRILHSPSNPDAKGTPAILEAINRLRERGHDIELVLIQNMPNERVLQEMVSCDFVVDQLYSDAPMAGFATEAAYFGKPAVVAGYFAPLVSQFLGEENIPPSLFVLPDEIESAIERLIVDFGFRSELGKRAYAFVKRHWDARVVGERFMRLLKDDVPDEWWLDPNKTSYLEGSGLPRVRAQRLVASVIKCGGVGALQLRDKPILERKFCEFSDGLSKSGLHAENNLKSMTEG